MLQAQGVASIERLLQTVGMLRLQVHEKQTVAPPHASRLWEGFTINDLGHISFFLSLQKRCYNESHHC